MRRDAGIGQNLSDFARPLERQRQQQPLHGDEGIAGLFAGLFRGIEHARQGRIEIDLAGAAAGNFRPFGKRHLDGGQHLARIAAGTVDQSGGEPLRIVEQHFEQMLGRELLMPLALRQRLGGLHKPAAAVGVFVEVHSQTPSAYSGCPVRRSRNIVIGFYLSAGAGALIEITRFDL